MKKATEMTDVQLLNMSASGDSRAFGLFARRHGSYLLALLRRYGCSEEDAQDLAQQAFMRAYQAAGRYREDGAAPRSWLSTIALNLARNRWRGQGRFSRAKERLSHEPLAPTPDMADALDAKRKRARLDEAVSELPEEQRAVVLLRIDGGLAFSEIAQQLGVSPDAAKQRFHRAARRLKKEVHA